MINSALLSPLVKAFFHHQVLEQKGILKTRHYHFPGAIANLFLAHSAEELICLCHFYPEWVGLRSHSAFATIGYEQNNSNFKAVSEVFPNAKIYTVFGNDLSGRLWDSRISLWQNGMDAHFILEGAHIKVTLPAREISFPAESFTLNRFFKRIGKFQTIPALKPRGGYRNFTEKFLARYPP